MKKYCQNCGFENAGKDKFCRSCGTKLLDVKAEGEKKAEPIGQEPSATKTLEPRPKAEKTTPPAEGSKISNKMVLGLAAVALVLSIAAISSAFLIKPSATVGTGAVGTDELAAGSVTGQKVADGTLTDADISNTGISKIATNAITGDQILNNSITFTHLTNDVADAITGAVDIANNSITSVKIKDGTIATADLANDSITSAKIADGAVNSADIATDAVGASEIAANAVGSSEIAENAVGTSELLDNSVDFADMKIKIRYGRATGVYNGSSITHNLGGSTPASVVVTPIYDPSFGSGNATIHANIISVGPTSFSIALWVEYEGNPGSLTPVTSGNTVDVYWIAIY